MRIAFYAPMKSPRHPVPSGDRLMARQLLQALEDCGADVRLASELRVYARQPSNEQLANFKANAVNEAHRLINTWESENWHPDVWFSYHPYYKAPDWIGPEIAQEFGCALVTAEASYSAQRANGPWAQWHQENHRSLNAADCHFVMTTRDRRGLETMPELTADLVDLPPFIDTTNFSPTNHLPTEAAPLRLTTIAMMRPDVKLQSYRALAAALEHIKDLSWSLDIVGDGDAWREVEEAFASFTSARIRWHGRREREAIIDILQNSHLFVWPGIDEGYGLVYLEAQAMGLPVVAFASGGVPDVVRNGETGILVDDGYVEGFAEAIRTLDADPGRRADMGRSARDFVLRERSAEQAGVILSKTLDELVHRCG